MYFCVRCDEEWIVMGKECKVTAVHWGKFSNTYLLGTLVCLHLSSKYKEGTSWGFYYLFQERMAWWGGGQSDLPISSIFFMLIQLKILHMPRCHILG